MIKTLERFTPIQVLSFGYVVITLTGVLLLFLLVSSESAAPQPFIDAHFTASSAPPPDLSLLIQEAIILFLARSLLCFCFKSAI